jgi:muramoyltetrapeptide carboxypeptidase
LIKPPRLKRNDPVRVVAPASPVQKDLFATGIAAVEKLGLRPGYGDPFRRWRYLAGSDTERLDELTKALRDPESRAVFFARGGYGTSRLLLDPDDLRGPFEPRILLGCSDITSLHLYFQRVHNWVVFHGPMVSGDFARGLVHVESFQNALMQTAPYALATTRVQTLRRGNAEGTLMGGCLTLLDAAVGTPWEPDWTNAILFLEDVATKPYQIDRMLTQLTAMGKFNDVAAFIFGEMKDCIQVEEQGYTLQEVILDVLGPLGKPIFYGFPSGHVSGLNWTLPLGVAARVTGSPAFRLEILEGAVE